MAAKIKDGLFIGDADSAGDPEFLDLNKIVNLGNLAAREVPNRFSAHGLVYLSLNWQDHPDFVLFDQSYATVIDIVCFVDESLKHGQSVLLFSTRGVGRCAVAACVYLMYKYRWGFEKSYDYIVSKKPDIDINRGFVHQLFVLDKKLSQLRKGLQAGACMLPGYQLVPGVTPAPSVLGRSPNSPLPLFAPVSSSIDGERARRESWETFYVEQAAQDMGSYNGSAQAQKLQEEVGDELLLIYSYMNSKNTITAVPGPYPDALRQAKSFAIKFNPDLYLNHLYEEPGGRFIISTSLSSGKPHPPLPGSPTAADHGRAHGPGHVHGILKGGKHHNKHRRSKHRQDVGNGVDRDRNGIVAQDNGAPRSIGFDSPPRSAVPLATGGWASPEQRLHDILDDLSNHNAEPVNVPADNGRGGGSRSKRPPSAGKGRAGIRGGGNRSGELTDTSDEDEAIPLQTNEAPAAAIAQPAEYKAAASGVDKHRDSKALRAESKGGGLIPNAPGYKDTGQAIYRPSVDSKIDDVTPPSLYDLANMQVAPAFQPSSNRSQRSNGGSADFDVDDGDFSGSIMSNSRYSTDQKTAGAAPNVIKPASSKTTSMPVAEAKQSMSHKPRDTAERPTAMPSRGYGGAGRAMATGVYNIPLDNDDSDIGQHSMLTGGGTIVIDAEESEDDLYVPAHSTARKQQDAEHKQMDSVTHSLLRAKQLAEDAMGRTSHSYQAQQERESHAVQQQDRARQRQGAAVMNPTSYSSRHPNEAWGAAPAAVSVPHSSHANSSFVREDHRSRDSVAAAAVAAAEAMASYRNGQGARPGSRGSTAPVAGRPMPRFDSTNSDADSSRGINRSDSSDRRPSVDRREQERMDQRRRPDWVGPSGSIESTASNATGSMSSGRTPKVYRHGSPAPRTANSNTSRLSKSDSGSKSSLRRDSLGNDSLDSAGGNSLGTQRSRESSGSYRRPSPSPYEQRQSSRPMPSSSSSATGPRSSTPTRGSTPTRPEREQSSRTDLNNGSSGSRSSTPSKKTTGWRF